LYYIIRKSKYYLGDTSGTEICFLVRDIKENSILIRYDWCTSRRTSVDFVEKDLLHKNTICLNTKMAARIECKRYKDWCNLIMKHSNAEHVNWKFTRLRDTAYIAKL